jgi:membrane-associated phospholipid phosphatase
MLAINHGKSIFRRHRQKTNKDDVYQTKLEINSVDITPVSVMVAILSLAGIFILCTLTKKQLVDYSFSSNGI